MPLALVLVLSLDQLLYRLLLHLLDQPPFQGATSAPRLLLLRLLVDKWDLLPLAMGMALELLTLVLVLLI
jgi:hypothetical protein